MSLEFREEMTRLASVISREEEEDRVSKVESELETIFGRSGRLALLSEFAHRYGVTVDDAIKRPGVFRQALFYLLGDLGSTLVMGRIEKRVQEGLDTGTNFLLMATTGP